MSNSITMQIEFRMGALLIGLTALFLGGVLWVSIQNYDTDQIVLDASLTTVKSMSSTERQLIAGWVSDNNITIPEGKGYRYLTQQYPDRPWLKY